MGIFPVSRPTPSAPPEAVMADKEAEVVKGRQFYEEVLIQQACMDPSYSSTFMILEAASIQAARARFDEYPQVRAGMIAFEFTPLIGMPAVDQVHERRGAPLPDWWPAGS